MTIGLKRWQRGMAILCCLVGIGVVVSRMRSPKPSLLQRSTRLSANDNDLLWSLSESETLLYHPSAIPFPLIEHRNIRTGVSLMFPVPFKDVHLKFSIDEISPDGKWIKWFSEDYNRHLVTYNVETHRLIVWPSTWDGEGAGSFWWIADSRHWFELRDDSAFVAVHDVDHPREMQKFRMDGIPEYRHWSSTSSYDQIAVCTDKVIFYPGKGVMSQRTAREGVDVSTVALTEKREIRHFHPKIGLDARIDEFVLSPDGSRIAWILNEKYDAPPIRLLRRLLPSLSARFQPTQSLWISGIDGSAARELGRFPVKPDEVTEIGSVHWASTGKQVTFYANGSDYLSPVIDGGE